MSMALRTTLPLVKLAIIIGGAGVVGTLIVKEGLRMSDLFSHASKVLKRISRDEKHTSKPKPLNDSLSDQVKSITHEVQLLASNRPVTIVNPSGSGGIKYGVIIIVVVGYGYVWWKGWKLDDMTFATKRSLSDATNVVAKQLETVYTSIAAMKRHLSSRIDRVDCRLAEVVEITRTTNEEVSAIPEEIKVVSENVQSIHNKVYTLESRLSIFELKQDEINLGVERLIRVAISKEIQGSSSNPALELPHRAKRHLGNVVFASGLKLLHDVPEEARNTRPRPSNVLNTAEEKSSNSSVIGGSFFGLTKWAIGGFYD